MGLSKNPGFPNECAHYPTIAIPDHLLGGSKPEPRRVASDETNLDERCETDSLVQ